MMLGLDQTRKAPRCLVFITMLRILVIALSALVAAGAFTIF